MRIKLLVPICGPEGNFKEDTEIVLSDNLSKALIKDGNAVEILEISKSVKPEELQVDKEFKKRTSKGKKEVDK